MESNLDREEMIFDAALAFEDLTRRRTYLEEACGGDVRLRSRIERLLATHDRADEFFAGCLAGMRPVLKGDTEKRVRDAEPETRDEQVGKRAGNYKLLQKIGEGGCGVVYMAQQEQPVRRRVALKIIKEGMDTRQVIARFEAERQALAMMDHPNIARVLDVGATDAGRPYFVMELVHGVKVTTFCDEQNFDTRRRLDIFIQVCRAIQHAHQKGIIHRDIKPSNILVTLHDGIPVPKVIDFGIAKATGNPLTDKTLFTVYGHFVGTPAYMSPEQAEMSGLDVDTRSDIYSLGVLLYELLTGRTPFDQDELLQSGFDEMRRTLREREPHRPSTKLDTIPEAELTATALHRHAEPPKLQSLLRGDLDWVVMKALEKDRSRRYETANALAMDIQRYLNDEPVVARPPSRLYQFQKLVRRNRGVFAGAGAVAVALVFGLTISTWLFFGERDARHRAVAAEQEQLRLRQEAEIRAKTIEAVGLIGHERYAEADELMKGGSFTTPTLDSAAVFRSLAEWHALRHEWSIAADRFSTLIHVDQLDGWNYQSMDFMGAGVVFALSKKPSAYNEFRDATMSHFAGTANPIVAERVLKIGLMGQPSPRVLEKLAGFARLAAPKSPISLAVQSPAASAWQKNLSGSIGADLGVNAGAGNISPDTTPPAVAGAYSYDGWTVGVEFTEPMSSAGISDPRNYNIAEIPITNAIPGGDAKSVVLQMASPLPKEFAVAVSGVMDVAHNRIAPGTVASGRVLELHPQNCGTRQPLDIRYEGQTITMTAGGADIYETADAFGFAGFPVRGDFDYRLRIHSISPALDPFTRVGLMARESVKSASSRHIMVAFNVQNSFQVVLRAVSDATCASLPPNPLPTAFGSNSWVRLERVGSVFHAYTSNDGMDWVQLYGFDSAVGAEGPFADPIDFGIVTCSHSAKATATAVAGDLGITPTVPVNATVALALLDYRRGDYEKAVDWCRRSLAHPEYNAARVATARTIMAMALSSLGEMDGANTQLEQAREMIERKFSGGLDLGGGAHGFWFDWVFARTLLQEADALVVGKSPAAK